MLVVSRRGEREHDKDDTLRRDGEKVALSKRGEKASKLKSAS